MRRQEDEFKTNSSCQPCWSCDKATGLCKWSHDEEPIDGWEAVKTDCGPFESYEIRYCPEYVFDGKRYPDGYIERLRKNGQQV